MKKLTPHPPRRKTANVHFGTCAGAHPHIFAVCPDADIEDALAHLSAALTSAFETNAQLATCFRGRWRTRHGRPGNRWKSARR